MSTTNSETILRARRALMDIAPGMDRSPDAAEGGCGVLGLASSVPVAGRHVLTASRQMHNRGNGKGGGIAMAGLDPGQMKVDAETLRSHTLLQIALLDPVARGEVEEQYILPYFDVAQAYGVDHTNDYRVVEGLEIRPPDVWRYFVRAKAEVLTRFAEDNSLSDLAPRALEDEFIYHNSFRLNQAFYASLGEKRAFVLCHGRDLIVLKIVGYAEQVVEYYKLDDQVARVWIAHQRYPTKGRVWHPGGAHPFVGLNEALVHNGDFANYHAVSEYLRQRNMAQLFLTDTEVSAQLFDLWDRVYQYPLEVTLEAMAPTTEHDFAMLPPEKQEMYRAIQATHIHGSPDGPWFFIVARSLPDENRCELIGITDTSMLRPQVFALYENDNIGDQPAVQIGLIASERQAIQACLRSLSSADDRYQPVADKYWAARGGSHTDGGAFRYTFSSGEGLTCSNKFGTAVSVEPGREHVRRTDLNPDTAPESFRKAWEERSYLAFDDGRLPTFWSWLQPSVRTMKWDELAWGLGWLTSFGQEGSDEWDYALDTLTMLRDRPVDPGNKRRASILGLIDDAIGALLDRTPNLAEGVGPVAHARRLDWDTRSELRPWQEGESFLILDTSQFPPEGDESAARFMVLAYEMGWRRFIAYNWRGGRFAGSGLGAASDGVRIDLYGDAGDYAASGLDGAQVHFHGHAQDQVGQVIRRGKVVIHGDVGQTFLYGAKGGEIYVRGSAAGRPLINAVGRPRAVINGTCLDYLAEAFMAGDPHNGGGFVVLNGVTFDEAGRMVEMQTPYPGGNLFSLASGGAIFLRDPHHRVDSDQLNGGVFAPLTDADWALVEPYLRENETLFGICIEDLLLVDGVRRAPHEVYRKVQVAGVNRVLVESENR